MNEPKILLVCYLSSKIGLGHLSRLMALANAIRKDGKFQPQILIFGDTIINGMLDNFNVQSFSLLDNFKTTVEKTIGDNNFDAIVFDIYPKQVINNLDNLLIRLKKRNIYLVSIDSLIEHCNILDLIWIPSFNFDCSKYLACKSTFKSGWDSFLIQKRLPN